MTNLKMSQVDGAPSSTITANGHNSNNSSSNNASSNVTGQDSNSNNIGRNNSNISARSPRRNSLECSRTSTVEHIKNCLQARGLDNISNCSSGDGDNTKAAATSPSAPPDGGFGWVVVMASFTISLLVDGVCFSQGIFFDEFRKEFNTDKATTSWIGSVLNGTYMIAGPLVSAMVNVYGCRRVACGGSVVAAVAFVLSTFSPNIYVFIFTYGLLAGVGFGMMYLPAIVMVGYYFERSRALATGIACCGSGIGAFLFAPLSDWLMVELGWRGATYVLAGLVLTGLFFSLFYRPLEGNTQPCEEEALCGGTEENTRKELEAQFDKTAHNVYEANEFHGAAAEKMTEVARMARSHEFQKHEVSQKESLSPLARKDIFYSGSIANLPEYNQVSPTDAHRAEMAHPPTGSGKWAAAFRAMFDVTLLKSPTFILYGTSCFLCMMGFFVPFTYMPTHAVEMGVSTKEAAFLISIIGISNIIGRVAVGFISDMPWADCLFINNTALVIGGLATFFVPYYNSYWMFCIYSVVFGLSIAVFVSLRSIIMVELMGLEKLTTAFGFVILCQGASSLIGSPIAGAISDHTGTYTYSFYMAGATVFLSGLICYPLRRVAKWEGLTHTKDIDVNQDNTG